MACGREGLLVVATWGNPQSWGEVNYRAPRSGRVVRSKCTLIPLLLDALEPASREVKVLIIIVDTLYAAYHKERPKLWGEIERALLARVREEWRGIVRGSIIEGRQLEDPLKSRLECLPNIVVCPGLGSFKAGSLQLRFNGSLELYASAVVLHVLRAALRMNNLVEVWLDLSHGINYLPSAAMAAVLSALKVLKVRGENIGLRVFNSDPYVLELAKGEHIFAINEMEIRPPPAHLPPPDAPFNGSNLESAVRDVLQHPHILITEGYPADPLFRLKKKLDKVERGILDLWYAASYGLPLIPLDYVPRHFGVEPALTLEELVDVLVDALYGALTQVIPQGSSLVEINTRAAFRLEKWRVLELLLLVTAAAEALWRASKRFLPVEVCGKRGYTLLDLREMAERFLVRTAPFIKHFFSREERELLQVAWLLEKEGATCWQSFQDVKARARSVPEDFSDDDRRRLMSRLVLRYKDGFRPPYGERTFMAHSGLTYNVIELCYILNKGRESLLERMHAY